MGYIYANLNPMQRNTNDCVVRAIAMATGSGWKEAYYEIAMKGIELCDTMESNSTWGTYLKENGWIQDILPYTCPDCYTLEDFCRDHPYGTYIVATGSHVVCTVGGNFFDTTDSGSEIVTYYFKREGY